MLSPDVSLCMSDTRRVDLFIRGSVPFDARARQLVTLGRLQALQARGTIDEIVVDTWANRIMDTDAEAALALAALDGFERWATSHHARLTPGFGSHECHSGFTGQRFRTTVLPVVCLALYEDDKLVAVYPHSTDGGCVTVADGLAMLEAGGNLVFDADTEPRPTSDRDVDRSAV